MAKSKRFSLFLCFILLLGMVSSAFAAGEATGLTDIEKHWAGSVISSWAGQGLTGGYPDGTFRPDQDVTRAEFMALMNRALATQTAGEISYTDVDNGDWYYAEVAKAQKAGYIAGYADGSMKPENPISREEAAVIIARVLKLNAEPESTNSFADKDSISTWSKGLVGTVSSSGYMKGYPGNLFRPAKAITRAESVATLSRVAGVLYQKAGTFGPDSGTKNIAGNLTVTAADVVLQNLVVEGTLNLTAGIGDGNVTLKNVAVKGTTIVSGGGEHSILLDAGTVLGQVIVERRDGKVRIVAQNGSTVKVVIAQTAVGLAQEGSSTVNAFGEVVIQVPKGMEVEIAGGIDTLKIETPGVVLTVVAGSTIGQMTIAKDAVGASIALAAGSTVTNLEVNAAADVTGTGTISSAAINVSGATIAQTPTETVVAPGTTAEVGGNAVNGGESTETSGGGGGGGGGSSSAVEVTGVTLTFDGEASIVDEDALYEISVPDTYSDTTLFTGFKVNIDPTEGTLVIEQLKVAGHNLLNSNIEVPIKSGVTVTTGALLGALDTGKPGVNLGSLRAFGDTMEISGYVTKTGYDPVDLSITINLTGNSSSIDLTKVNNQWLTFTRSGTTVIGTIKSGEETTMLKYVPSLDFLFQDNIKINGTGYPDEGSIKTALAGLVGKDWDKITLDDLSKLYDGENIIFGYEDADGFEYTLTIIK